MIHCRGSRFGGGGGGYRCQFSVKISAINVFVSFRLNFWPFVSCQLISC